MIELKDIRKEYVLSKDNVVTALNDINLKIDEGEFVAIVGKSGSRKINSFKYYFLFGSKNKRILCFRRK